MHSHYVELVKELELEFQDQDITFIFSDMDADGPANELIKLLENNGFTISIICLWHLMLIKKTTKINSYYTPIEKSYSDPNAYKNKTILLLNTEPFSDAYLKSGLYFILKEISPEKIIFISSDNEALKRLRNDLSPEISSNSNYYHLPVKKKKTRRQFDFVGQYSSPKIINIRNNKFSE